MEDSGTVTSVLIPWNTCGAYQSGVLNVGVGEYFIFAVKERDELLSFVVSRRLLVDKVPMSVSTQAIDLSRFQQDSQHKASR